MAIFVGLVKVIVPFWKVLPKAPKNWRGPRILKHPSPSLAEGPPVPEKDLSV